MDDDTLKVAFEAHKKHMPECPDTGRKMMTRRMVINLADMADQSPREMVHRCERLGLCPQGSWDWIKENGGIQKWHLDQVRADRRPGY